MSKHILIDADGCPVVDLAVAVARANGWACTLVCDTAHEFHREGAETVTVDKGADSADFALVNRVTAGDIVVTQDYGLAAMCLAKRAIPLSQDGFIYNESNIEELLFRRYETKKQRIAGFRFKGPPKRTAAQNTAFLQMLVQIVKQESSK